MGDKHSVSVAGAVVREDGRVLAIRRHDNGAWEAPGGVLELDETVEAGLAREIREETGIEAEPVALTGVYKNMKVGVVALFFRCRQVGGAETLSEETTEVRWILPSEIETLMAPTMAVRLLDALSYDGQPQIRTHDGVQLLA
ncbi:8-oxo-dGTP diphosphatase [Catenulispora sp. GP43]|uniref:NUDIX hydrolase n=1 Tax=Catenulispora sp. GP43 TaxID=3156263 RepID=UPI0035170F3C